MGQKLARVQKAFVLKPTARSLRKPDRVSHTLRSLEIAGILSGSKEFITADRLIREIQKLHSDSRIEESGIKRAMQSFQLMAGQKTVESSPGKGYKISEAALADPKWILPVLAHYIAICQPESSFHPALASLVHSHGVRSLYYIIMLHSARERNLPVRFLYTKSSQTQPIEKRVQVAGITIRGHRALVYGKDLRNQKTRQYIIQRISGKIHLEEIPLPPLTAEFKNKYTDSLNVYLGGTPTEVTLRFDSELLPDVRREFYHETQKIAVDGSGILLEMQVNNADEVFSLTSRYLGKAEIIKPVEWREEYAKRLKRALKINGRSGQ